MIDSKIQIGDISVDAKSLIIAAASLILSSLTGAIGYQVGNQPREVVCSEDIERARVLKETVEGLQVSNHKDVTQAAQICIQREQDICDERILNIRERMTRLRCKICAEQTHD